MNESPDNLTSRRDFIKNTGKLAAASALAGVALPHVHAADDHTIRVALIGCGGRGGGAAANALAVKSCPTKLVAMADVFEQRLKTSYETLKRHSADQVEVSDDSKYIGFDAYKKAMDALRPGDIAILTTPPAFRWVHFTYAIQKGLNVFMEKPVTVDGPTSRRMFKLAEEASAKNLKVGVGLMSRHSRALQELHQRVQDGEIGDVILLRGYRMHGPVGSAFSEKWPGEPSELLWQIQRFHSFLWASGGCYSDFYIHHIDHLCWMKNAWPVKAQAVGARHYRGNSVDQNFDNYSVEYTFADGAKFIMNGRCNVGCEPRYYSLVHGSKAMAVTSTNGDCGLPAAIYKGHVGGPEYKGQNPQRSDLLWESKISTDQRDPYQNEWNTLIDAIRKDQPYNEVKRGVEASLVTSLGRMAAHTGQEVTYEGILSSDHEFAPGLDKLTMDSPAPLKAGPDGKYPVPQPGIVKDREY